MPSTLPTPMPLEQLRRYRWATPITAQDIPVLSLPALGITDMYVGKTTVPHVFADSPDGGVTPVISQTMWGYGSCPTDIRHPGPTLVAQAYVANQVQWTNTLPEGVHHPFVQPPVDARLGGMMGRYSVGHACVHLHGAHVPWTSDGHPVRRKGSGSILRPHSGAKPSSVVFDYPNTQLGGCMLWYHDHTMDMTSMNVYSGLAGGYLLRDPGEAGIDNLPCGDFEMPLIIQDRSFTETPDTHGNWMLYGDAPYLRDRINAATGAGTPGEKRTAIQKRVRLWANSRAMPCASMARSGPTWWCNPGSTAFASSTAATHACWCCACRKNFTNWQSMHLTANPMLEQPHRKFPWCRSAVTMVSLRPSSR